MASNALLFRSGLACPQRVFQRLHIDLLYLQLVVDGVHQRLSLVQNVACSFAGVKNIRSLVQRVAGGWAHRAHLCHLVAHKLGTAAQLSSQRLGGFAALLGHFGRFSFWVLPLEQLSLDTSTFGLRYSKQVAPYSVEPFFEMAYLCGANALLTGLHKTALSDSRLDNLGAAHLRRLHNNFLVLRAFGFGL